MFAIWINLGVPHTTLYGPYIYSFLFFLPSTWQVKIVPGDGNSKFFMFYVNIWYRKKKSSTWIFLSLNRDLEGRTSNCDPDTSPTGHFPDRHFPYWHISDWTIPRLTLPRLDISPTRHLPEWLFPLLDISPAGLFPDQIFPRADIYSTAHFPDYTFPPSIHIISEPTFPWR